MSNEKKSCFGNYENNNNSWHCLGCISVEECKKEQNQKVINVNRPDKDTYYLDIALAVSKRSTCLRRHYGCVIVKDDIIIATGYNGSPRGYENCCDRGTCKRASAERYTGYENCDSVHAEQNALIAASRDRLIGSTVYLACEEYINDDEKFSSWDKDWEEDNNPVPCSICEKMLKNAGVLKVVNRRTTICL